MPTPTTFASALTYGGLAAETTQGTPVAPTATILLNKEPGAKDNQVYLEDKALHNSMAEVYAGVLGPLSGDFTLDGDFRADTQGYLLNNIMGANTVTGTGPFTYVFSLNNAAPAQQHSFTFTDWSGVTASTGARAYPGAMLSELTYTLDPTKLATFSAKALSWGSAAAATTPTVTIGTLAPVAGWITAVGIGGPATGGTLMANIANASVSLARKLKIVPVLGGKQPYIIRQGPLGVSGKLTFVAADESPLTNYLTAVQPQLQLLLSTGTGTSTQKLQVDMQQCYYKVAQIQRGSEEVEFTVDYVGVANTTNVGASGGFSPVQVTLMNSTAGGSY